MPGGFQLGHSLAFFQGALVGAWFLWGLVLLIFWLCALQLAAFILKKINRAFIAQWIIRLLLIIKSAPVAALSGLMLFSSLEQPNVAEHATNITSAWESFVFATLWFAFIPTVLMLFFNLQWVTGRFLLKVRQALARSVA
jgi:hypothetical protein